MDESALRKRWQRITLLTLLVGYAGYYFCRSNLSIAGPLLLDEFAPAGFTKATLGAIATIGTGFYFVGKLVNGVLSDLFGGRRMFLLGMVASVACTIAFGRGETFFMFAAFWAINRFVQSMGWGALVKIASRWFAFEVYGTVMGILSLSFLFGDAVARLALGEVLDLGFGWRRMFFVSAAVLLAVAVASRAALKSSPTDVGLTEPEASPAHVYDGSGEPGQKDSFLALVGPLLRNRRFWVIAALSFGLTLIRESFNLWTPIYLHDAAGVSGASAAIASLYFPLFGGISVVFAGVCTDKLLAGKRGGYMAISLAFLAALLLAMSLSTATWTGSIVPHVLVSLVALLLAGPYSFLAGAMSLDLGGKRGSATAAGLVDGVGYVGGMLSGYVLGVIAEERGWNAVFGVLAAVAALSMIAALVYWKEAKRASTDVGGRG